MFRYIYSLIWLIIMIFTITFYWQTMSINDERVILSLSIHYVYLNLNVITSHAVSTATEWSAQDKDIRGYFQLLHIPVYFQCHGSLITTFLNLTCCMCLTTDTHPVAVASQSCCYGCLARSLERFVCSSFLVVNNLRFSCGLWCVITAAPHSPYCRWRLSMSNNQSNQLLYSTIFSINWSCHDHDIDWSLINCQSCLLNVWWCSHVSIIRTKIYSLHDCRNCGIYQTMPYPLWP